MESPRRPVTAQQPHSLAVGHFEETGRGTYLFQDWKVFRMDDAC